MPPSAFFPCSLPSFSNVPHRWDMFDRSDELGNEAFICLTGLTVNRIHSPKFFVFGWLKLSGAASCLWLWRGNEAQQFFWCNLLYIEPRETWYVWDFRWVIYGFGDSYGFAIRFAIYVRRIEIDAAGIDLFYIFGIKIYRRDTIRIGSVYCIYINCLVCGQKSRQTVHIYIHITFVFVNNTKHKMDVGVIIWYMFQIWKSHSGILIGILLLSSSYFFNMLNLDFIEYMSIVCSLWRKKNCKQCACSPLTRFMLNKCRYQVKCIRSSLTYKVVFLLHPCNWRSSYSGWFRYMLNLILTENSQNM